MSRRIGGSTRLYGVVGSPVAHSLSPAIFNSWLAAAEIDAVYLTFDPQRAGFEAFVEGIRSGVVPALNVTAPFKERALRLADTRSDRAAGAGSANVLIFEGGAVRADSTDGVGLLAALAEQAPEFSAAGGPVAILGAGGAAKAAAATLLEAGAPSVRVINRTLDSARTLAATLGSRVSAVGLDQLGPALEDAVALINATPQLRWDVPWQRARPSLVVVDMVYRPVETPLLAAARAAGLTTVDGLAMLIGQARPSFAAMFGRPAPELDARSMAIEAAQMA